MSNAESILIANGMGGDDETKKNGNTSVEQSCNFRDPHPKRWIFSEEELENSPSRRCGMSPTNELEERRKVARFIRDLGKKLHLPQLCINTGTMFMHRFFSVHSFTDFPKYDIGMVAIFLASKVEDNPRPLVKIITITQQLLNPKNPALDVDSWTFEARVEAVITLESILLQTVGWDIHVQHVHTYVAEWCILFKVSKEVSRQAYRWATTTLMMTTLWLRYRPSFVACVCIHVASSVLGWKIPNGHEGNKWWMHLDLDKDFKEEDLEIVAEVLLNYEFSM